jgi:ribulose bisphosphate carboxylase small subunit
MFARISFDDKQRMSKEEFLKLQNFLADEILYRPLYTMVNKDSDDDKLFEFYSWEHTVDPLDLEKEDNKKKLVKETNQIEIKTDKEYLINLDTFMLNYPALKIKVRGIPQRSSEINDFSNVIEQMNAIENKMENALKSFNKSIEFNQKCDVHISNLGLLHINQIGYAVDKCTEQLQDILNKGWKIIACCVQPDQRRPDYILGKYNPDGDNCVCENF